MQARQVNQYLNSLSNEKRLHLLGQIKLHKAVDGFSGKQCPNPVLRDYVEDRLEGKTPRRPLTRIDPSHRNGKCKVIQGGKQ